MRKLQALTAVGIAAGIAAGCIGYERETTLGPSPSGGASLIGNWTSGSLIPQPGQCSDFKWNATELTANSASGSFSATCAGDLHINGTAQGTLSGSVVNWTAQANASVPEFATCPISLSGTAELLVDSIRIPYSGTTCLGPVSGIETLRRR
jgi:hypothetical protein